ncbi:MAG TPA: tRNA (guanosine(46)-N7)-methyltransferase TrmB [Gammaproteobacteria bacterium]|nr:tRNA (guanosine(46)-N7)-methyltransferase TrmB [Gammaproteobacteria bacterium]
MTGSESRSTAPRIRSFVRREGRLTAGQARALDRLWPQYGLNFTSQPVDPEAVFRRHAPLTLEIGSGNGEALAAAAAEQPDRDFLGVEVYRPGVGRLLGEIETRGLENVRVISHDAVEVLESMLPSASLDQVLIYFPDPWPKKRHHKRRLVRPDFLPTLARALKPGGRLELATDWEDYAQQMLEVLSAAPDFSNLASSGSFAERPPYRPQTRFERRGMKLGHGVWDVIFRRN